MTQIKETAIELINRLPDDKIVYIINILKDLERLFAQRSSTPQSTDKGSYILNMLDSKLVPIDNEKDAQEYIREVRDNDRV